MFERVDPALGGEFQTMIDEGLLDLESRKGKAPGGYCETLHFHGRPFIFMNAVGLVDDVMTLLHEAGHAFHAFASHPLPLIWQRHPGSEAAELASMSMEFLAAPHLAAAGGLLHSRRCESAWLEHLEDVLLSLAHIASVDAFQTWIYTSGQGDDAAARDQAWLRLRSRFERGVDWSWPGAGAGGPMVPSAAHLHVPVLLHRIRHRPDRRASGLAQQPGRSRRRGGPLPRGALRSARCAALPEIYRTAGARLTFDADAIGELVQLVESHIERAPGGAPPRVDSRRRARQD